MEVLLATTNRQTSNDSIRHATDGFSNRIDDQNVFPSITCVLARGEMEVESIADLIQNLWYASVDLSGQISPDHCEIVDESVTGTGSEPFESEDFVLCFGRGDCVLWLMSEPFGVAGW